MTTKDKIEILNIVSDIFFEISRYFKTEIEVGYDHFLNIEEQYKEAINFLEKNNKDEIEFRIISKVNVNVDWDNINKQKFLLKTTNYIFEKFPILEKRIKNLINFKYSKESSFVLLGLEKGLVILPMFESDKDQMSYECKDRMIKSHCHFTSYESSIDGITDSIVQSTSNGQQNPIKIGYTMIRFKIGENMIQRKLNKIKKFKFF